MNCPYCNQGAIKNGTDRLKDGSIIQTYHCKVCGKRFNERTATPMAHLRTAERDCKPSIKDANRGDGYACYQTGTRQIPLNNDAVGTASSKHAL